MVELLVISITASVFYFLDRSSFERTAQVQFETVIQANSAQLLSAARTGNRGALESSLKALASQEKIFLQLIDSKTALEAGKRNSRHAYQREFPLGKTSRGPVSLALSKDVPPLSHELRLALGIMVGFHFLIFVAFIYGMHRWAIQQVFLPLDRLIANVREGRVSEPTGSGGLIPDEIQELMRVLRSLWNEIQETSQQAASVRISSQVAHDIRSPLTALNVVLGSLSGIPEEKRVLARNSIERINDIANNLLRNVRNQVARPSTTPLAVSTKEERLSANPKWHADIEEISAPEVELVSSVIEMLVSEKREQFRSLPNVRIYQVPGEGYGLFARLPSGEFRRALSNLINNAVEALPPSSSETPGEVRIRLEATGQMLQVSIIDQGRGIPSNVLRRVGERGFSFGKAKDGSGSGLGVHYAKHIVESVGGLLRIESTEGQGTTVIIELPKVDPPEWFVPAIELRAGSCLVVLDDDHSIHEVWRQRLRGVRAASRGIDMREFASISSFCDWFHVKGGKTENPFLVDYELIGETMTGLDVVRELGISRRAYLVTSRWAESRIRNQALELGMRIIPKSQAPFVPIVLPPAPV